jgi:hypothetical protein
VTGHARRSTKSANPASTSDSHPSVVGESAGTGVAGARTAPVPVSATCVGLFDAFDGIVTVPPRTPLEAGWNCTLTVQFAAGVRFAPLQLSVTTLKSADPESARVPMASAAPPVLVTTSGSVVVLPTVLAPKSSDVAESDAVATSAAVPVPPSAIVPGAFDASDASESIALAGAAVEGVYTTLIVQVAPGASVPAHVVVAENCAASAPEGVSAPRLTAAVPVLVTTTTSGPLGTPTV